MKHFTFALFALFPIAFASAQPTVQIHVLDFDEMPAAGLLSIDLVPAKPKAGVVDELDEISPEIRKQTEHVLKSTYRAPTFVVVKDGALPTEPDTYGNEILRRWISGTTGKLGAVVMVTSEPKPVTHIVLAGRGLEKVDVENLRDLATAALGLAPGDLTPADRGAKIAAGLVPPLETFAQIYSEALAREPEGSGSTTETGAAAVAALGVDAPAEPTPPAQSEPRESALPEADTTSHWDILSAKLDWQKVRVIAGILGVAAALILAVVILPRLFRTHRYTFPEHEPRRRFDAPYSGGSNAQVSFGSR